ncbi:MAG TPA: phenylphosphate carboxylase subunit delta [Thermoanaerobaculia bacterium]|jgi:3-deoxy-D-manno-octulosonate 8-phosphate phosphatase (KDO 8-P phosphatase)
MAMDAEVFARRAAGLEWLLFDVDGVLTNGLLLYTRRGEQVKLFHVRDGLGFRLAQRAGLKVGLLSGRRSRALERRAAELDFDAVILGTQDKREVFEKFLDDHATAPGKVAFVADDLPDLPVLGRCALSFAPADAVEEVRAVVHVVLATRGGEGAAREMIERVLKARGDWERVMERFSLDL